MLGHETNAGGKFDACDETGPASLFLVIVFEWSKNVAGDALPW